MVALLALAAGAAVVLRPGPVERWLAAESTPTPSAVVDPPEPPPPPVLAAAGGNAPTAAGVQAAIGSLTSDASLGPQVAVSVVDVAAGKSLFAANPDAPTVPASTTKIVTAATVLAARGPAYRLSTRVVAGASPGEVVIIGGGDPTLGTTANKLFPGAGRLDKLAEQVKKSLGDVAPTGVVVDDSLFTGPQMGPGWDSGLVSGGQAAPITALAINGGRLQPIHNLKGGDARFEDPARGAGQAFARALGVSASAVSTGRAPQPPAEPGASAAPGAAVAPGTELGRVESPPLVRIVDWMLQLSDNVLAEALARHVAIAAGEPASFSGAATAMKAGVAALGLAADESALVDGSGLSRQNKMTPTLLTDLLALAASGQKPELTPLFGGLPVAGWSGTLQDRFLAPTDNRAARGLVRAKTGTLSGVSAISGQLVTADNRLLVFAIMADAVPDGAGPDAARTALDRIAAKLVTCGCT